MPTPKQTTSKSTSTKKRDVLGPIQAKRFASQYPLLDNPANLPIDQVQSLLITALRGDIQQLKHQVKALEEIGANVFALTWNVNHLHKSSRFKDDVFMSKADICEVVMLVEVTDSVIYFAKKAKSEAPQIFEKVVNSYEFDWTARLQGQAVAHKSWNIWEAITVPQTEAQALSILQDNVPAYWHSKVQAMWKQAMSRTQLQV